MEKKVFEFTHKRKEGHTWVAEVGWHDNYRDYVILKQKDCSNGKIVTIIMHNPGRFKNNKDEIYTDSTLRHIRKAFENSGYTLEILNLFNLSQATLKKFKETSDEIKNNCNPLEEILKQPTGRKIVVIQWGKPKTYSQKRQQEVYSLIEKNGLNAIGLRNKDGSYSHPSHWKPDKIKEFREKILPEIDRKLK